MAQLQVEGFCFFHPRCSFTDDSMMIVALAQAILDCNGDYSSLDDAATKRMQEFGRRYLFSGYGLRFQDWLFGDDPKPCNSYGNGAAMRVSACGYYGWNCGSFLRHS